MPQVTLLYRDALFVVSNSLQKYHGCQQRPQLLTEKCTQWNPHLDTLVQAVQKNVSVACDSGGKSTDTLSQGEKHLPNTVAVQKQCVVTTCIKIGSLGVVKDHENKCSILWSGANKD